jgi:hypothetical protein
MRDREPNWITSSTPGVHHGLAVSITQQAHPSIIERTGSIGSQVKFEIDGAALRLGEHRRLGQCHEQNG